MPEKRKVKTLLVDDDEINLLLAETIIQKIYPDGIVFKANNGIMAIEQFNNEKPDIIFMDLHMPEMSGFDATVEIRKMEAGANIPIIALTAGIQKSDIDKCISVGMSDFANKPVQKKVIERIFHKWFT